LKRGNLKRCLNNLKEYCNYIAVYDDGSTDGSYKVLKEYGCDIIRGKPNDFLNETTHKQHLLSFALRLHPDIDWFFWLDCDEVLDANGTKNLRKFCEEATQDGYYFREITLWRSDCWARLDYLGFGKFLRLWRNNGNLKFNIKKGLHADLFPQGLGSTSESHYSIIHYGYATKKAIVDRWQERTKYGVPVDIRKKCLDESELQLVRVPNHMFPKGCKPKRIRRPDPIHYDIK